MAQVQPPTKIVSIDEEGFPLFGELRVTDPTVGREIFENMRHGETGAFVTTLKDEEYLVEAFDEPLVALNTDLKQIHLPYGLKKSFDPKTLTVDEWDRFHGRIENGTPFVFSRAAQSEFFNLVDEFDDESVTINGETIELPPWLNAVSEVQQEKYWTQIYKEENYGWELNAPATALVDLLPRLKLPKSRVLILGAGSGNDAAYFAENGHVVTAVDFSPEAIARAKAKYAKFSNIQWLQADIFQLGTEHHQAYDLVFEHTCYCAIDPSSRKKLVQRWLQFLVPGGHLMGVFFAMDKPQGPPFGGSEWELRERLKKHFHFIFWGRWHQSVDRRQGKELLVYAQKKS
jgi:SAM-dependent methyltransferase